MNEIEKIVRSEKISEEDIFKCVDFVRSRGDAFILKADGERESGQFTVFINRIGKKPGMLRADGDELADLVVKVSMDYLKCEGVI